MELMAEMASPLWLVAHPNQISRDEARGQTVWLNTAARRLLGLDESRPASNLTARFPLRAADELHALPVGRYLSRPVIFHLPGRGRGLDTTVTCRLTRIAASSAGEAPLLFLEAAADIAAREEVERLNEQLVAISFAYPDFRLELRRDGTIVDFSCAQPGDLAFPSEQLLNQHIRHALPIDLVMHLEDAFARLGHDDTITGFDYVHPASQGLRYFECRVVAIAENQRYLVVARNVTAARLAELGLRCRQARQEALLQALPDLVVLVDRNGSLIDVSGGGGSTFNPLRQQLSQSPWPDLLNPLDAENCRQHLHAVIDLGQTSLFDFCLELPGGLKRYYQSCGTPHDGTAALCVLRDVSGSQAEASPAQEREQRYRLLLDNAADLIFVLRAGLVDYESPSVARLLGSRPEERYGKPFLNLVEENSRWDVASILRTLPSRPDGQAMVSFSLTDRAGNERCFEARCADFSRHPLINGVILNARDVTERRRAERHAVSSHRLLLNAIECISEGFELYDAEDRLVLANSKMRELYPSIGNLFSPGVTFGELLRTHVVRGGLPEAVGQEEAYIANRLRQHRQPGEALEQQLADGRCIRVEERRTWDGGVVVVRSDITARKQWEERVQAAHQAAEDANRRKSEYVHHLSHELRTPLTALIGFAQVMADGLPGAQDLSKYQDFARRILDAGRYMLDLSNTILDLAKIDAGRMPLNEEVCDLALLIAMTASLLQGNAEEAGIQLRIDVPEGMPALRADTHHLRQMLLNLISNAIKYGPERDGEVIVRAALATQDGAEKGGLIITVTDNGVGMAPEQIPQALEMFGQVHRQGTRGQRGTGLGLPLTQALMALHGGRLDISSQPGVGTCARLLFPPERTVPADASGLG